MLSFWRRKVDLSEIHAYVQDIETVSKLRDVTKIHDEMIRHTINIEIMQKVLERLLERI